MQTKTLSELLVIAASDAPEDDMALAEVVRRVQQALNSLEINMIPEGDDKLVEVWMNGTRYVENQIPRIDRDNPQTAKVAMILEDIINRGVVQALVIEMMKEKA